MTAPLTLPELPLGPIAPDSARSSCSSRILFSVAALLMFCPLAFGTVDAWLQPPDVLHCSTNECHDFRSFLLASRADMM